MRLISPVGRLVRKPLADETARLSVATLEPGTHVVGDYIIRLGVGGRVEWVISRVCDHANGTLLLDPLNNEARCPLHGWRLNLDSLIYETVGKRKARVRFEQHGDDIYVPAESHVLEADLAVALGSTATVRVRFLAHASLALSFDGFTLVTDPWLKGPCFMNGWWPAVPPAEDALDVLYSANLVYISHNHPDHLHAETLSGLLERRPDIPIVVPEFATGSTQRPLVHMGFSNVVALPFNELYRVDGTNFAFGILKSGDFRDDSGLYVTTNKFQGLLTVDSAALNSMVLPRDVDFLATAFAGGASGYPLCFEHIPLEERRAIVQRHLGALRKLVRDYVAAVKPRVYMPYAGYFSEAAARDRFIRGHNAKNSVDVVRSMIAGLRPTTIFVDPRESDEIVFRSQDVVLRERTGQPLFRVDDAYIQCYLDDEPSTELDLDMVAEYFSNAGFEDSLVVYLQPTDEEFNPVGCGIRVDFSVPGAAVTFLSASELHSEYAESGDSPRRLYIRARRGALHHVLARRLPWENMSIGFQCRIERHPDIYNADFWYHFTNVYIEGCGDGRSFG